MPIATEAVNKAIQLGAIGYYAIKLIAYAGIERRPARLDLSAYPHPHPPKMDARTTAAADDTL